MDSMFLSQYPALTLTIVVVGCVVVDTTTVDLTSSVNCMSSSLFWQKCLCNIYSTHICLSHMYYFRLWWRVFQHGVAQGLSQEDESFKVILSLHYNVVLKWYVQISLLSLSLYIWTLKSLSLFQIKVIIRQWFWPKPLLYLSTSYPTWDSRRRRRHRYLCRRHECNLTPPRPPGVPWQD